MTVTWESTHRQKYRFGRSFATLRKGFKRVGGALGSKPRLDREEITSKIDENELTGCSKCQEAGPDCPRAVRAFLLCCCTVLSARRTCRWYKVRVLFFPRKKFLELAGILMHRGE